MTSMAHTTNVYGLRRARRTIHMRFHSLRRRAGFSLHAFASNTTDVQAEARGACRLFPSDAHRWREQRPQRLHSRVDSAALIFIQRLKFPGQLLARRPAGGVDHGDAPV